jgi:hypothetical protein
MDNLDLLLDIDDRLIDAKKLMKKLSIPQRNQLNHMINDLLDFVDDCKEELKLAPMPEEKPGKAPKQKSKRPAPNSEKIAAYREFVKNHMHDSNVSQLPVNQRMGKIAEMWKNRS